MTGVSEQVVRVLCRKAISALVLAARRTMVVLRVVRVRLLVPGAVVPWSTTIGRGVEIRVTDGGSLALCRGVHLGTNSSLTVQGGRLTIGRGSFIGHGCIITAKRSIDIGCDVLVAEYVTIRDQDHRIDTAGPLADTGFDCAPVEISDGAWVGAKASVLRGSSIGAGAVIGAHSLVRGTIPAHAVAVGIPARVRRYRDQSK